LDEKLAYGQLITPNSVTHWLYRNVITVGLKELMPVIIGMQME